MTRVLSYPVAGPLEQRAVRKGIYVSYWSKLRLDGYVATAFFDKSKLTAMIRVIYGRAAANPVILKQAMSGTIANSFVCSTLHLTIFCLQELAQNRAVSTLFRVWGGGHPGGTPGGHPPDVKLAVLARRSGSPRQRFQSDSVGLRVIDWKYGECT